MGINRTDGLEIRLRHVEYFQGGPFLNFFFSNMHPTGIVFMENS